MATNWPQQVNPRACRSALCVCTADWNSKRENNCRSCENILLTRVKADPPSLKSVAKPDDNLSEAQPFFGISFQIVIWTRVVWHRRPILPAGEERDKPRRQRGREVDGAKKRNAVGGRRRPFARTPEINGGTSARRHAP